MEDLTHNLEVSYLTTLERLLLDATITIEDARLSAQAFLDMLPLQSLDDAEQKVSAYCRAFPVFVSLQLAVGEEVEKMETSEKIERMQALLRAGNIDEALAIAQEANK